MRYALLLYSAPEVRPPEAGTPHESEGVYQNWVDYTQALKDAGVPILGLERLQEVETATTLRRRGGQRVLTDGPFAETKEHLLGIYLIDVPDLDTALDWADRMPFIEWGTVEVRPVMEGLPFRAVVATGERLVRAELCDEAIWLGRLLPRDAECGGLLALMLLHHSRSPARYDAKGRPVPLAEQDRGRWRRDAIAEGLAVLDAAVALRSAGPYQLQAAIAALHAQAPAFELTDWSEIATLYGVLARLTPSPVVEVNRAVAVGLADGPRAGLALLEPVLATGALGDYAPLHAAHADLLERAGEPEAAAAAWQRAIQATQNPTLQAELKMRRGGVESRDSQP